MVSIIRRISASAIALASVSTFMELPKFNGGSQRLMALAQQLRLYKPPPFLDDIEEQSIEESARKVVSPVGFPESAAPIAQQSEKFRPKRAAVLICLFEGDGGDLRVILTKRSSKLSTHSGQWSYVSRGNVSVIILICLTREFGMYGSLLYLGFSVSLL